MATTISLSVEMKEKLKQLGKAGDSYDDIIRRMYEATKKPSCCSIFMMSLILLE